MSRKKIAVFASGNGSNAENLCRHFEMSPVAEVSLILCNRAGAKVLERAERLDVKSHVFSNDDMRNGRVLRVLSENGIDFIVLAGFMQKIPDDILSAYENRIVNIHPSLLPKYGGKGMYGMMVHEAVCEAKEKESGITIHFLNSRYDEGRIIFQAKCPVEQNDTPEDVAAKVHALEYRYYPETVERLLSSL